VTAKSQLLMSQTLAGRGTMDVIAKLRRVLPEGVNVRKVEFMDLSDRASNPIPKKRVLFHQPGRGIVFGPLVKMERDKELRLWTGSTVEVFALNEISEWKEWEAPSKGIQIEGEIDENVKGGANPALDAIRTQLIDPSRGVSAELASQEPARDKPGWRVFRIVVRFE
jgi:hypothetical protein